jgi:hypothetical protein
MASTYTTNLKLTKQGDGENPNSWGQILNDGVISLLDDAIAGYQTITISAAATVTLTNNQGSGDQARSAILEINGAVGGTHDDIVILIPNNSKSYIVKNSVSYTDTTDTVILRVVGNAGVTLEPANTALYVTNGTTVVPVARNTFTNITATSIGTTNLVATSVKTTDLTVSVSAMFVDNAVLNIGTGSDLKLYHTGTHSYVQDIGTGSLYLAGSNVVISNAAANESMITAAENGAVGIYHDNAAKLVTTTVGVSITGNMVATTLYGDGSNLTGLTGNSPQGYISGLTLSQGTDSAHDINISSGIATDVTEDKSLSFSSTFVKQIDATWASGSTNGGMASGVSLSTNTWYHLFIVDTDAGGVDAGFDTSLTAANLLGTSGVASAYRRIGSVLTDGSSNILPFTQFGDEFIFTTQITNVGGTNLGTSRVTQAVSTPLGVETRAILGLVVRVASSNSSVLITLTHPNVTDATPTLSNANNAGESSSNSNGTYAAGTHIVRTNGSSQVAFRQQFDGLVYINTNGYYDDRGKDQ